MTSERGSSTETSSTLPSKPGRAVALAVLLVLSSVLVYFSRTELPDVRRFVLALAAFGLVFAPASERRLRLPIFLAAVALVAWTGQMASAGEGGLALWLGCSLAGAVLLIRAGGRAQAYFLPPVETDAGLRERRVVRANFQTASVLFLGVFLWDAFEPRPAWARASVLALAAVFFLRYFLLQAKFLGLPAVPLLSPPEARGLVPSQRWPLLAAVLLLGASPYPGRWLQGSARGPLLVTSVLLLVLAGLVFVVALTRLQKAGLWSRSLVRRTSFFAGMSLAVALAAALVELEMWGPRRLTAFSTFCTFVLVVLPFAHHVTRLFRGYAEAAFLIPPAILSVMFAPVAAMNGLNWSLTSSGFLFAFAVMMLSYQLVVTVRMRAKGALYLAASLIALVAIFVAKQTAWSEAGSSWKIFLIAVGFTLYAIDLFDRAVKGTGTFLLR